MTTISQGTLTDEQIALNARLGIPTPEIEGEVLTSEAEVVEIPVKEIKTRKFNFKVENTLPTEEPRKRFKLSEEDEELKQFLITEDAELGMTPSLFLARQRPRVHIGAIEESTGLAYGVFNGAGKRAITMYNPDHPDAPTSGPNYGKVFYRWSDEAVVGLLHAIFEQCFEETSEEQVEE